MGESKALNDKTVIYRDGCIRLDPLIIAKTNFDAGNFHISEKPNDDKTEEEDY